MESSKSILNFGASVKPGQWFDIRSEGLQPRFFYDVQVTEVQAHSATTVNTGIIEYRNYGDGLCKVMDVSPQSFVRKFHYFEFSLKYKF